MTKVNNIYPIDFNDAKEYLDYIHNIFAELEIGRQIFNDYTNALEQQRIGNNDFIHWTLRNYYQITVLQLCKLTEPRKQYKNKHTLRHFINLLKYNSKMLEEQLSVATVPITDFETGEIGKLDISADRLQKLHQIDFEQDLSRVKAIHKNLQEYRNCRLCHNERSDNKEWMITIKKLHGYIDALENIFRRYFGLFGTYIDYDSIKKSIFYGNFHLELK